MSVLSRNQIRLSSVLESPASRVCLALVCSTMGGCLSSQVAPPQVAVTQYSETGIRAASLLAADTDVDQFRYTIRPCGGGDEIVAFAPIEDQTIPGHLGELVNKPLDVNSEHEFADHFETVPVGCYSVLVEPIKGDGTASEICESAWQSDVDVKEGKTTEILLIVQCQGEDLGALDVIATINHEPQLLSVEFDDSKFVCGDASRICVEARDVDGDPLEFVLEAEEGCEVDEPQIHGDDFFEGVEACFDVTCTEPGRFDLTAQAFDLAWIDGRKVRIEDWLIDAGYPSPSRASLEFWSYIDGETVHEDSDDDGFGDESGDTTLVCDLDDIPDGWADNDDDCDDSDSDIHPDADEICGDGIDQDCDGEDKLCEVVKVGNSERFEDGSIRLPTGALWAVSVTVEDELLLTHLGIISRDSGPEYQLALYTDDDGIPGELVATTEIENLVANAEAEPAVDEPSVLDEGDYWIALTHSQSFDIWAETDSSELIEAAPHAFGDPLPDVFPEGWYEYAGVALNLYLVGSPK